MRAVHKPNLVYTLLRPYVDLCTRFSYRRAQIWGRDRIPANCEIILLPNHCNALMDALVVLRTRKGPTAFGCRADLFNNKFLAEILYSLRILPMVRVRDGLKNVLKNYESMDYIVDAMENDLPFCMFCEGTHRTKHSLLPIKKGGIRTALHAIGHKKDVEKDVYLMPIGLEYGDYFRFRSTSLVEFGDPINLSEYMRQHPDEAQAETYRNLEAQLKERMSSLITYIPDDENHDGTWALTKIMNAGRRGSLRRIRERNRKTVARILSEEKLQNLREEALDFEDHRKAARISLYSLGHRRQGTRVLLKSLLWLVWLPLFLVCSIIGLPLWLTSELTITKVADRAFHNSVRCALKVLLTPLFFIIYAVLGFIFLPWWAAAAGLVLYIISYSCFYDFVEFTRILVSDFRLAFNPDIRKRYKDIISRTA